MPNREVSCGMEAVNKTCVINIICFEISSLFAVGPGTLPGRVGPTTSVRRSSVVRAERKNLASRRSVNR